MSNQTLQRQPTKQRARTKTAARTASYRRQTARMEGRRDGTPLIFGWGGHLTRVQKQRYQRRAAIGFFGVIVAAILGVFVFGIIQQNVLVPNETIVSVNAAHVSQDTYRKQYAYKAQVLWNKLQSEINEQRDLLPKIQDKDQAAVVRNQALTSLIIADEANYKQDQIAQDTITSLTDDQLILQGAKRLEQKDASLTAKLEPSAAEVSAQLDAFKKAFPANEKYTDYLAQNNLSNDDLRAALTTVVRRTKMQTYLASLLVSPTRQAHLRRIETGKADDAKHVLDQLNKNVSWDTLAKQSSLDPNTKAIGGDLGWISSGTNDAVIENWAFAPERKVNDISPVIKDAAGTYDIVQVLAFDPSRAVNAGQLKTAQDQALDHWLSGQRGDTKTTISSPVSDMLSAARNLPTLPNLNATLPNEDPNHNAVPQPGA